MFWALLAAVSRASLTDEATMVFVTHTITIRSVTSLIDLVLLQSYVEGPLNAILASPQPSSAFLVLFGTRL